MYEFNEAKKVSTDIEHEHHILTNETFSVPQFQVHRLYEPSPFMLQNKFVLSMMNNTVSKEISLLKTCCVHTEQNN